MARAKDEDLLADYKAKRDFGNTPEPGATRARKKGDGFVINGDKLFVPYAHVADWLICLARTGGAPSDENGLTLFLVDTAVGGLKIEAMKTMSGEKLCVVSLNDVAVPAENVLGEPNGAWGVVNRVLDEAAVAECARMVGGARWVLETTLDYAHHRIQFGRPIGSFQAIQHKLADMATDLEAASVATCYAAWMIEPKPGAVMRASALRLKLFRPTAASASPGTMTSSSTSSGPRHRRWPSAMATITVGKWGIF